MPTMSTSSFRNGRVIQLLRKSDAFKGYAARWALATENTPVLGNLKRPLDWNEEERKKYQALWGFLESKGYNLISWWAIKGVTLTLREFNILKTESWPSRKRADLSPAELELQKQKERVETAANKAALAEREAAKQAAQAEKELQRGVNNLKARIVTRESQEPAPLPAADLLN